MVANINGSPIAESQILFMGWEGVEPTRRVDRQKILSLSRLPFRHQPIFESHTRFYSGLGKLSKKKSGATILQSHSGCIASALFGISSGDRVIASASRWARAWAQWWAAVLFWVAVAAVFGLKSFLFIYLIPLGVANAIQMSYIATNHFLNPETRETNDPLINSLTVRVGPLARVFHLNFNYHVEHHVLPSMNPYYARLVHDVLVSKFADRYQEMPHWKAIYWLYRTPRIHWDSEHLVNPRTGTLFETIGAHEEPRFVKKLPVPVPRARGELAAEHVVDAG